MLDVLGLAEDEERAYRFLVERSPGSAAGVADGTGLDLYDVTRVLAHLEAKGLVARAPGGDFVASPPAVALGALMVERQQELRRAELDLEALNGLYRQAVAERGSGEVIDVVRGSEAVAHRFAQLQRSAKDEIQMFVRAGIVVVSPDDNDDDEDVAQARGVRYRVVLERAVLERPGFVAQASKSVDRGMQLRVAKALPVRLMIVDRELGLVPLTGEGERKGPGALLIHSSPLLDALRSHFELVWQASTRLVLPGDGAAQARAAAAGLDGASDLAAADLFDELAGDTLEPLDATVLSLLLSGLTDQAVGSQLDLSLRTVQRRVRHLMDRAGVDTRLQLGHEAARRGWT
jgi:sugar-specific transcriptional regulator TrmB/DNA-binding CsgD family transcriptional regulator